MVSHIDLHISTSEGLQVGAILTLLRLGSTVVTVGSLIEATDLGELASTTGVQGDYVLALVVDSFDDVDLANRVLVKVVRPAVNEVSSQCLTVVARSMTHKDGQTPQAVPGMCSISAIKIPESKVDLDSRRTLSLPCLLLLLPRSFALLTESTPMYTCPLVVLARPDERALLLLR